MTTNQLISHVARVEHLNPALVKRVINRTLRTIRVKVDVEDPIQLKGIGTLHVKVTKSRMIRRPGQPTATLSKPRRLLRFRAVRSINNTLNEQP